MADEDSVELLETEEQLGFKLQLKQLGLYVKTLYTNQCMKYFIDYIHAYALLNICLIALCQLTFQIASHIILLFQLMTISLLFIRPILSDADVGTYSGVVLLLKRRYRQSLVASLDSFLPGRTESAELAGKIGMD